MNHLSILFSELEYFLNIFTKKENKAPMIYMSTPLKLIHTSVKLYKLTWL